MKKKGEQQILTYITMLSTQKTSTEIRVRLETNVTVTQFSDLCSAEGILLTAAEEEQGPTLGQLAEENIRREDIDEKKKREETTFHR